jgi:RimJ/RimL family protein N-acetyltransferase
MKIKSSTFEDIDAIFELYAIAVLYQKIKFPANQWPEFDRKLIETEILENRQWKLLINDEIACVWATTFSDPEIWEERNIDPSVYIHRIATNPNFRGQNFVRKIVNWAIKYAQTTDKQFIRLDTCGDNKRLIMHYIKSGFEFLGMKKLKNADNLPAHYINADVCFFEINLEEV